MQGILFLIDSATGIPKDSHLEPKIVKSNFEYISSIFNIQHYYKM